jgi:cell division protein FtsB
MFFIGRGVIDMTGRYQRATAAVEEAKEEYKELLERKQVLEGRIEKLQTKTGVEEELRSKFSVSKEGEKVIQLIGEIPYLEEENQEETSIVHKIMSALF